MNPELELDQNANREEMARLMELLRTTIGVLGFSRREIERRSGFNHNTAVKYLNGEGEPRLEFLLAAVRALGLEYWEFFDLAYPGQSQQSQPSATGLHLRHMLERLFPSGAKGPAQPEPGIEPLLSRIEELRREVLALVERG